jgi:hypothetical protein
LVYRGDCDFGYVSGRILQNQPQLRRRWYRKEMSKTDWNDVKEHVTSKRREGGCGCGLGSNGV